MTISKTRPFNRGHSIGLGLCLTLDSGFNRRIIKGVDFAGFGIRNQD
ncbi:hypothetical protein [Microcoleus sp. M2_C4]